MDVIIGKTAGFCSGVQRAILKVKDLLQEHSNLYCLGEIIHNPEVIQSLKDQGMRVCEDIDEVPEGSGLIIRTHGLPKNTILRAREKQLGIHDFTCPKVQKIHHLVTGLIAEGYHIIIVGNPKHPEVKAVASLVENNCRIIEDPGDVPKGSLPEPNAVVVQTTFNPDSFFTIIREILTHTKKTLVCNTLCDETIKRQREARDLAGTVDRIVVVGGKNSSNTKTLFNIARETVPAVHIENAAELEVDFFQNTEKVGVLSGASTPAEEVKRVAERLSAERLGKL